MRALKLMTRITKDHRLDVVLPNDVPEGDVEVIVLLPETISPAATSSLCEFTEKLEKMPSSGRSKADIDCYLDKERASWD